MLTYEQALTQLEALKPEIVKKIAVEIKQQKLTKFANLSLSQIEEAILPSVEMTLHFFRTGDASAIKAETQKRTKERSAKGFDLKESQKVSQITGVTIWEFITRVLANEPNDAVLVKFRNRGENINALSKVASVNQALNDNQ